MNAPQVPDELLRLFHAQAKVPRSHVSRETVDWLRDLLSRPRSYEEICIAARQRRIPIFEVLLAAVEIGAHAPADPRAEWRAERPESTRHYWRAW